MSRQDTIRALVHMLRPLAPEEEPVERDEEESTWAARVVDDAQTMSALLDLARNLPSATEHARVSKDAFRDQLAHVLALAGAHAPAVVLEQVGPLTEDAKARAIAIEVIGEIGASAGTRWLAPLVEVDDLSEDEGEWLASSLGNIGTAEASALIDRLAERAVGTHANVQREIAIARDAIARRNGLEGA